MKITEEELKKLLVGPGHIDEVQFKVAVEESKKEKIPLESLVVKKGLILDEQLGKVIADRLDCLFVDLKKKKITNDVLTLIPEIVARSQKSIVFERTKETLKLATSNPDNYEFIKLLEEKIGLKVEVYYATPLGVEESLKDYQGDLKEQVKKIVQELTTNSQSEKNIVKLVNLFLEYAHDNSASDIHI